MEQKDKWIRSMISNYNKSPVHGKGSETQRQNKALIHIRESQAVCHIHHVFIFKGFRNSQKIWKLNKTIELHNDLIIR